jgi:Family of unknown function (DUF6152)
MRNGLYLFLAATIFISVEAVPSFAHHGTAEFDLAHVTVLKGTVTNFTWVNPHAGVEFEVRGASGDGQKWQGSLISRNLLARDGWTRETLKPGDRITVSGNESKVRANSLWITKIQRANGEELPVGSPDSVE